jgi:prepilin-type N-terminal cleavage/methylation domain-containing protein
MKSASHPARGFTLIELIIVTVIMGIMATALVPLTVNSLRAYRETVEDVEVIDKLRYATERLAREVRQVQYASNINAPIPPATACSATATDTNHYCITTMEANSLVFRVCATYDYTPTYTTCSAYRTITIGTTSTPSASCVTAPCVTLAYDDVSGAGAQVLTDELGATTNLVFAYYQSDGTTPATLAGNTNCKSATTCVSYIELSLTLTHNNNPYTQRTRIGLRTSPT